MSGEPVAQSGSSDTTGLRWVYDDGRLRGFVQGWAGATASLSGAFDPSRPAAVAALVKRLAQALHAQGARSVWARLPFDSHVAAALSAGGVGYRLVEEATSPAGNMLLLADLPAFLAAVGPEWRRRLPSRSSWQGHLRFEVGEQAGAVDWLGGRVVESAGDEVLRLAPPEFLLLALGYRGFGELRPELDRWSRQGLFTDLSAVLSRRPGGTGPLG